MARSEKVGSREYKIMLRPEQFVGDEAALLTAAGRFWEAFQEAVEDLVVKVDGSLDEIENRRTIRFFDTPDHRLRRNDYVFRERIDRVLGEREVTLKFRHPDRYISQERDMEARKSSKTNTKFEEDIKPKFLKLYSYSTKQPIADDLDFRVMQDPADLFPGLADELDDFQEEEAIEVVGAFSAYEMVIAGGEFQIRQTPKMFASCVLVVWYDEGEDDQTPVVAEFSFKYKDEEERYTGKVAQRAYRVFEALQNDLPDWIDMGSTTKTAYVYSRANTQ